ncbi:solute carrier family 22 member 6-B-like [Haemaphysalis longicornis]
MEVTDLIGETGLYQNVLLALSMYRGIMLAINNLCASFLFPAVDHWCARTPEFEHWSTEIWKEFAIPHLPSSNSDYDPCYHYVIYPGGVFGQNSVVPCDDWEYDHSEFWPSGTETWNLVCGNAWKNAMPQSAYMIGMTFGFVVMGRLSDMFGRRPVLLGGLVSYVLLEYAMAFVQPFGLFCLLRFFNAVAVAAANNSLTMYVESIGPAYRGRSMIAYGIFWGIGIIVLAGLSAMVPGWQYQLLVYATMYVLPLLLWRFIVESPKWLLTAGKYREAEEAIKKIAWINGLPSFDEESFAKLKEQYKEQQRTEAANNGSGILALCRSKTMIIFTLTNIVFQFCTAVVRYQLALDTDLLPVNPYLNFVVGGVIEVASGICSHAILVHCPRRTSTGVFLIVTALSYIAHVFVPRGYAICEMIMTLIGRLCIGNVININIIYLSEMFPTGARALAIGFAQTVFGIGAAVQPHIKYPMGNPMGDSLFHALIMLLATVALLTWPETRGRPLPDFVASVESCATCSTSSSHTEMAVFPNDVTAPPQVAGVASNENAAVVSPRGAGVQDVNWQRGPTL